MKNKNSQKQSLRYRIAARMLVVVLVTIGGVAAQPARADQYDQQIQSLQQQNNQTRGILSQLTQTASSYQDAIGRIQAQIDQIQQQLSDNQAKQAYLAQQIQGAQNDLDTQRHVLGELIRTMYVDAEPTLIEELATSKNLSDFVDKQTYRAAVQQKTQGLLKQIAQLRDKLALQKSQVDQLLQDEHAQQAQLGSYQTQQTQLLYYNQSQQTSYNQQILAKDWPGDARAAGIPEDTNPTRGSIAISTAGTRGHSMYVEKVSTMNGQPAIYVSQYNTDFTGHYSEGWRYTNGLVFIHF